MTWLAVALGAAAGAAVALMLIGAYGLDVRRHRRRARRFHDHVYEQQLQKLADAEQARRRARLNVKPAPHRDPDDWGVEEWHG